MKAINSSLSSAAQTSYKEQLVIQHSIETRWRLLRYRADRCSKGQEAVWNVSSGYAGICVGVLSGSGGLSSEEMTQKEEIIPPLANKTHNKVVNHQGTRAESAEERSV